MKVLWISAYLFDHTQKKGSGVWQKSLAVEMMQNKEVVIGNIAPNRVSSELEYSQFDGMKQWGIPSIQKNEFQVYYAQILKEFHPDVIHVWGAENFLKLTPFISDIKIPTILFMQGVLDSIGPLLLKSLTFKESIMTLGLREIITRNNVFKLKKSFDYEGLVETKMIQKAHYIAVQSEWTRSQINHLNPTARFFKVNRALREEFLNCSKWSEFSHSEPIIYTASIGFPLKGTDVLLKALSIVKQRYPLVKLKIAGAVGRKDFLADGYIRHLMRLIRKYDLTQNIVWLDSIDANDIVKNLQQASVFVNPSLIESYSLVLAEAMAVGTPAVVSYAGAMPELAEPNKEALFFTPLDYKNCAYQILKILDSPSLSKDLSFNAINRTQIRNQDMSLSEAHIKIYQEVLDSEKRST